MYLTTYDRVIRTFSRASQKHHMLKPLMFVLAVIFKIIYGLYTNIINNGKKYGISFLVIVFFFMSSSFAFPEISNDNEIYLTSADDIAKESETEIIEVKADGLFKQSENIEWIEDTEIYKEVINEDISNDLSSTDNIDVFTLEDFINQEESVDVIIDSAESSFDASAWNLILVNKTHPIPDDYEVPLTTLSGSMKCDERVLEPITSMLLAAKTDNVNLIVCSPYRDYELQSRLFDRKITLYMNKGYSYLDAYKLASEKVTVPGASEHQIGMAFDIVTDYHATLDYAFGDTTAGKWLKEHCKEYGFILRYPKGKEYITSIEYEPWHFRYVGIEAATYIMENELTLEEFIEKLQ